MSPHWESNEYRSGERVGVKLIASEDGVLAVWGSNGRTFNPAQARMLAEQLTRAAAEAEKRGAQDWMEP